MYLLGRGIPGGGAGLRLTGVASSWVVSLVIHADVMLPSRRKATQLGWATGRTGYMERPYADILSVGCGVTGALVVRKLAGGGES